MSKKTHSQDSNCDDCYKTYLDSAEYNDKHFSNVEYEEFWMENTEEPQFQFDVVFEPEKQTELQKIKRWISKRKSPLNTILMHLFSYVEKWYWEGKTIQTMTDVDRQIDEINQQWDNEHTIRIRVEEEPSGVAGLPTLSIRSTFTESGSEESESGMEASSIKIQIPDPWDENV